MFLISALDGGAWRISRPYRFALWEEPSIHLTGGCVGPTPGLGILENTKSLVLAGVRTPCHLAPSLVTILTTDCTNCVRSLEFLYAYLHT